MRLPWLDQYSNIGADRGILSNLKHLEKESLGSMAENMSDPDIERLSLVLDKKSAAKSMISQNYLSKCDQLFLDFDELKFNIFKFEKELGSRSKVLPLMTLKALDNFNIVEGKITNWKLDTQKLYSFLHKIQSTYKEDIQYHNDLHGADVMHMCYYFLKKTRLVVWMDLSELDVLSMLIAGVCHDLGHDGFTNGYHVNTVSSRAIDSNDISAQESYHASEMYRIISQSEYKFIDPLTRQE